MSLEPYAERRGRPRYRHAITMPDLTSTGRIRKGTKGRPEHGCVFCGKVYSRREHLRRHQGKHKKGAYPCIAPGCTCTFHNPVLLERHRHHDWCFPFQLPDTYLFRCPSRPEPAHGSHIVDRRSTSATPVTPSDDGMATDNEEYATYSPTLSHTQSRSSEPTLNTTNVSLRPQYLEVPNEFSFNRSGGDNSRRPMAVSGNSSPAVMQSNHDPLAPNWVSNFEDPLLEHPTHYRIYDRVAGTDPASILDPRAGNCYAGQFYQPAFQHTVSHGHDMVESSLCPANLSASIPGQHEEPRYSRPFPTQQDASSGNTDFYISGPSGDRHEHDDLCSLTLLESYSETFYPVLEGTRHSMLYEDINQGQSSQVEHSNILQDDILRPTHQTENFGSSRGHKTANSSL